MDNNSIKNMLREEIVGKSIQILRNHKRSDKEIREILLKDFSISKDALDRLLSKP